jgi:hypothetical protein
MTIKAFWDLKPTAFRKLWSPKLGLPQLLRDFDDAAFERGYAKL